jgi:trehalose synthase
MHSQQPLCPTTRFGQANSIGAASMITLFEPPDTTTLEDYGEHSHLAAAVQELRREAAEVRRDLRGRSILMVNSTSQGGGVAEMLPKLIGILKELGIPARWAVMAADDPAFFRLTKRIHNMVHGAGNGGNRFTSEERQLFDHTGASNADALKSVLAPDDVLVIHDPQPLALGAALKKQLHVPAVWRCHIGLDEQLPSTRAAWEFLKPYVEVFDSTVFSTEEYVPDYAGNRASIIPPALDPLSGKNRYLRAEQVTSILGRAGLAGQTYSPLEDPLPEQARRLQPDGSFGRADDPDGIGFLYRPIVTQVSRWDRLKGFKPLLDGFVLLKQGLDGAVHSWDKAHRSRLEMLRLVMAGPDPSSIQDDPEGSEVLKELCASYRKLDPSIQKDVALIALPMGSRRNNALMVNAVQTASSIVVQNSIREGFGLTLTEAMWKGTPVVGSSACGLRRQMQDRVHGRVIESPQDPVCVARVLGEILCADGERHLWVRNARMKVHREFLIFSQVKKWLGVLKGLQPKPVPDGLDARTDDSAAYSSAGCPAN